MAILNVPGAGTTGKLFYEDEGAGAPIVLVRDESIANAAWKRQVRGFLEEGHRVVTYDRREHGRSSPVKTPARFTNDANTNDLDLLVTSLDLQHAAILAHATSTGDLIRYLSRYGSQRAVRAALIAPLPPFSAGDVNELPDFRADLRAIDVPVLIVAEIDARFVRSPLARHPMSYFLVTSKTILFAASPAGLLSTHAAEVNAALLHFIDD